MSNQLTAAEVRFVRALCGSGPLGFSPHELARALGVKPATVGGLSTSVERKGFCRRERHGMRVFLYPTSVALALNASAQAEDSSSAVQTSPADSQKSRAPRMPRTR